MTLEDQKAKLTLKDLKAKLARFRQELRAIADNPAGDGDNLPLIDLMEPQFSHREAVEITGVSAKALSNWTDREVINLGVRHRSGRRLYSIMDLIQLRIVWELRHSTQMWLAFAAAIGNHVAERWSALFRRDEKGEIVNKDVLSGGRHYLVGWFDNDNPNVVLVKGTDFLAQHNYPHPIVVVPLDKIIAEVSTKAVALLGRKYLADEGVE